MSGSRPAASNDSLDRLARLPFAEQCQLIDALSDRARATDADRSASADATQGPGDALPDLLHTLGTLRDHQPLAYAVATLARRGLLGRSDIVRTLHEVFTTISDTGIQRVLACADDLSLPDDAMTVLIDCAAETMTRLPLDRLAVVCLIDRWLKNHASRRRDQIVERTCQQVASLLRDDRLAELTDEQLLLVPGAQLGAITAHHVRDALSWRARLIRFAERVLDTLERAPKSLSQANAEDILARRVYTDPGHFLFELLQNAEDAGARAFRLTFDTHTVSVWHDGVPFDAKDVVGVLSIGQTTKRKDQIGFFGVGFKSVYEVCSRPRVYSGPFSFEIADVSIPRRLDRPQSGDTDVDAGTLLVLHLRDPDDPQRSAGALFERALTIPAQTLLTLSSLRRIEVKYESRCRAMWIEDSTSSPVPAATGTEGDLQGPRRVRLCVREDLAGQGQEQREQSDYLLADDRFQCTDLAREAARVSETRILVAVALDRTGVPRPLDPNAPTVFSFLPTRERSGLRFLIHAHFDLPVDRERLSLDSPWNHWAIAQAGVLLARIVRFLCREASPDCIDGALAVLPLPEELAHPAYAAMLPVLARSAADIPFLTGADGARIAPTRATVIDNAALARALAGHALDEDGRHALAPITDDDEHSARRQRLACALGAPRFTVENLVALLVRTLDTVAIDLSPAGLPPPHPWLSPPHSRHVAEALAAAPASSTRDARLRPLPIFVDDRGQLHIGAALVRASRELRAVYGDARAFLHPTLTAMCDRSSTAADWCLRMGVRELGADDLLADLRSGQLPASIIRTRTEPLFDYLARLPEPAIADLGTLAIFPTNKNGSAPLMPLSAPPEPGLDPYAIAWLADDSPFARFTATFGQADLESPERPHTRPRRPAFIADALARTHRRLLRALGAHTLDIAAFVAHLPGATSASDEAPGSWTLTDRELRRFHAVVDSVRADLTPRLAQALAQTRIFPDRDGRRCSLIGPERALVPHNVGDSDLYELVQNARWLAPDIAALAYVRQLDVQTIGVRDVVRAVIAQHGESHGQHSQTDDALQLPLADGDALTRVYRYLARWAKELPSSLRLALSRAPIWRTADGTRHQLDALRRPAATADLRALYRIWDRFPIIAEVPGESTDARATSSWQLCQALELQHLLRTPDYGDLVRDLVAASADAADAGDNASDHASDVLRPLMANAGRTTLIACLRAAADELPRSRLRALHRANLFRSAGRAEQIAGHSQPLGLPLWDWTQAMTSTSGSSGRPALDSAVARAHEPLRTALLAGTRPVLADSDEAQLGAVFDAMGVRTAQLGDLIRTVHRDPAYRDAGGRARVRRALMALIAKQGAETVRRSMTTDEQNALNSLPLWPCRDGRSLPAAEVVRGRDLGDLARRHISAAMPEEVLRDALTPAGNVGALLHPSAEADADALSSLFCFSDPMATLRAAVTSLALAGRPLDEQPPLLSTCTRVAALFIALGQDRSRDASGHSPVSGNGSHWDLPLVVDANGCLQAGRRHRADARVLEFTRNVPMYAELAHPAWAQAVEDHAPGSVPAVGLRRILATLVEAGREPYEIGTRSHLGDPAERAALYDWLLDQRAAVTDDAQAQGALGRACVIATEGGHIRSPRSLLLDDDLPELGIDWNAHDEVPDLLCDWLRATYALDDKRLAPLMNHLLDAHDQAVRERDGQRSAELLTAMARALRIEDTATAPPDSDHGGHDGYDGRELAANADDDDRVQTAVKRFKLRKRLRVEDSLGEFTRPRALLAPAPKHWRSMVAFAETVPARVSPMYDEPAVRRLIHLAGARAELDSATVDALLSGDGRQAGLDASVALACYAAERASVEPRLRHEWRLDKRAWIPDRDGHLRAPERLYWPDSDTVAVVGQRSDRFPHPRFFHAVPANVTTWLPFRRAADAALSDVAEQIRTLADGGQPAADAVLDWLESGLRSGRIAAEDVRTALADAPFLADELGRPRLPSELLREDASWLFGDRRGRLRNARAYSRLASALKIGKRPGKREVIGYCAEILDELDMRGSRALLAEEPELLDRLGRCMQLLAQSGGQVPDRLPLPVEDTAGNSGLCPAPQPDELFLRAPEVLWQTAIDQQAPVLVPLIPHGAEADINRMLRSLGVPSLARASGEILPAASEYRATQAATAASTPSAPEPPASATAPPAETRQQRRRRERAERRERARQERADKLRREREERAASQPRDEGGPDEGRPDDPRPDEMRERSQGDARPDRERDEQPDSGDKRGLLTRIRRWLSTPDNRDKESGRDNNRDDARDNDRDTQRERARHKPAPRPPGSDRPDRRNRSRDHNREREYRPPGGRPGHALGGASGLPDHSQWFRPRQHMGPQLGDNSQWADDRQNMPVFGLAFAPRRLPAPHLYAAQSILDHFDVGGQRWTATALPTDWAQAVAPGGFKVRMRGRLPAGEVLLPVPAYGRVIDLSARPDGRLIASRGRGTIFYAERDADVEYTVALDEPPDFGGAEVSPERILAALGRARHLAAPTVPDRELPDEVHDFVDSILETWSDALGRVLAVREFIRTRYYYDPAYIENPVVGRWLSQVSRGRGNAHIAAMHAGRDADYLGRGVCYELNSLACELIRRVGIPAAVATGWTLDRGQIDEPDHLWAVALMPTEDGMRWLPIDASTTRDGQPLHSGRRPPGPWRARQPRQRQSPPTAPSWSQTPTRTHERDTSMPISDLMRVLRHLESVAGEAPSSTGELRKRCRELLGDPAAARQFLAEFHADD